MQTQNPSPVVRAAGEVFNVLAGTSTPLQGFDKPWNDSILKSPQVKSDYIWDADMLKMMIAFFYSGNTALKLIGETGTGKTEYVTQYHAALNMPLFFIVANPKMEAYHLIGREIPTAGGTVWRDGPVLAAARHGLSVLIDEYNVIDPGEATGLNSFLEGRPYTVPDTGETVVPAPGFRIFVTVNPNTFGYSGRNIQDMANDDRFIDLKFNYPEAAVEEMLITNFLVNKFSQQETEASNVAKLVVKCANEIRNNFVGRSDKGDALPFTMSRRGALEWAKWTILSASLAPQDNALFHALDVVLGNRQGDAERVALHRIVEAHSGLKSGRI